MDSSEDSSSSRRSQKSRKDDSEDDQTEEDHRVSYAVGARKTATQVATDRRGNRKWHGSRTLAYSATDRNHRVVSEDDCFRPYSSMDRVMACEAVDLGSSPSRDAIFKNIA